MSSLVLWVTPIPEAAARPRTELLESVEPDADIRVVGPGTTDTLIGLVRDSGAQAIVVYSSPEVDAGAIAATTGARVYRPVREPYKDNHQRTRERTTALALVA